MKNDLERIDDKDGTIWIIMLKPLSWFLRIAQRGIVLIVGIRIRYDHILITPGIWSYSDPSPTGITYLAIGWLPYSAIIGWSKFIKDEVKDNDEHQS